MYSPSILSRKSTTYPRRACRAIEKKVEERPQKLSQTYVRVNYTPFDNGGSYGLFLYSERGRMQNWVTGIWRMDWNDQFSWEYQLLLERILVIVSKNGINLRMYFWDWWIGMGCIRYLLTRRDPVYMGWEFTGLSIDTYLLSLRVHRILRHFKVVDCDYDGYIYWIRRLNTTSSCA